MNEQSRLTIQNYGGWPPLPPSPYEDPVPFSFQSFLRPTFVPVRINWKGEKFDKRSQIRGNDTFTTGSYTTPNSNNNQHNNRSNKTRKFHSNKKKRYDKMAPFAPRNTTSFLIRAKKSGGIASLVSPCALTPAILPTPKFSPSKELLVDMAKEEWGVDGYGSMNGLIRLRSPHHDDEDNELSGTYVERRLGQDLSRFEMIYPSYGYEHSGSVLSNRVDDHDTHIEQLEEENLVLKERLFLMESELEDMKMRVHCLEISCGRVIYDGNEEGSEINGGDIEGDVDVYSEKSVGDCAENWL